MEVELNFAPKVTVCRPGDTLIVVVPPSTSLDYVHHIRALIKDQLSDVEPLIVGANDVLVYRPDAAQS